MSQWGTIQQAAIAYGVTEKTIRRWISSGVIEARRVGPRLIRVNLESAINNARPLAVVA
ncbi:helix-turn-helix domain-containing protein [Microbacterium sp. E-13]|uniref:helix-turn-helix domain-containing protein n=1 Tax=Microbacterium sp. E-13 TaxID=3404048 RepID=UPI003CF5C5BF